MRGKKTTPIDEAFAAKYRDNPRAIAKYLNDSLSTGDPLRLVKAVGDMVRAQGVTRFSQSNGMRRDTPHGIFKGEVRPPFDTVMNVLTSLGIQIAANPIPQLVEFGLSAVPKAPPTERLRAARKLVSASAALKATSKKEKP